MIDSMRPETINNLEIKRKTTVTLNTGWDSWPINFQRTKELQYKQ